MARNQVQFQKGLSEARFAEIYGTEEQCHAALVNWRWPNGFECPGCNGADHCVVTRGARRLFQCNACRKQTSVKAGTIFASSKLPLRIWFKTIYLVTQSKKGISSIELGRRLGVTQARSNHPSARQSLQQLCDPKARKAPRSSPAPISSPTVWHASPLSPKRDACTPQ